jgi:O-antigen ligase
LGACIALVALIALTQGSTAYAIVGLLVAVVVTVPIYVLGILVAAQGQILKATLDTAVTNSPFLKREEMAKVMSL